MLKTSKTTNATKRLHSSQNVQRLHSKPTIKDYENDQLWAGRHARFSSYGHQTALHLIKVRYGRYPSLVARFPINYLGLLIIKLSFLKWKQLIKRLKYTIHFMAALAWQVACVQVFERLHLVHSLSKRGHKQNKMRDTSF